MDIQLTQPEAFNSRVFLVKVRIYDSNIAANEISFEVPLIDTWLFRSTENPEYYVAPLKDSISPLRGNVVNGQWECIVQSNGVSVEANPIHLEEVKNKLMESIESATLPFWFNGVR